MGSFERYCLAEQKLYINLWSKMNIFGPLVAEKYENGPKMRFPHKHAGIFVTSEHSSDMRVLLQAGILVTSGHFSDNQAL